MIILGIYYFNILISEIKRMKSLLLTIVIFHCTYSEATNTGIGEFEKKWFSQDNIAYFVDPHFNENESNQYFVI